MNKNNNLSHIKDLIFAQSFSHICISLSKKLKIKSF